MFMERRFHLVDLGLPPDKAGDRRTQIPGITSTDRNGGKSVRRPEARTWNTRTAAWRSSAPATPREHVVVDVLARGHELVEALWRGGRAV